MGWPVRGEEGSGAVSGPIGRCRTMPLTVPPLAVSALDSWIEALAARHDAAWHDVLRSIGLALPRTGMPRWLVRLSADEMNRLSMATRSCEPLDRMTLSQYDKHAFVIRQDDLQLKGPWVRRTGSRFCPKCLRVSDQWQLRWRLSWAFVCCEHSCMLEDVCPRCGRVPRLTALRGTSVPAPRRCSHARAGQTGRDPQACAADLSQHSASSESTIDESVVRAQRTIDDVLLTGYLPLGSIYDDQQVSPIGWLSDIRALANRILGHADLSALGRRLPPSLSESVVHDLRNDRTVVTQSRPATFVPRTARLAAAGVLLALDVLTAESVADAGTRLAWVVDCDVAGTGTTSATTAGTWGVATSRVLEQVQLSALSRRMKPSDHLRYRALSGSPRRPASSRTRKNARARRTPTYLWHEWTLPLTVHGVGYPQLAACSAAAIQLCGTRQTLDEAGKSIASPLGPPDLSRILQSWRESPKWVGISTALIRMADVLDNTEGAIDYRERRRTNYDALLPAVEWFRWVTPRYSHLATPLWAAAARELLHAYLTGAMPSRTGSRLNRAVSELPSLIPVDIRDALVEHATSLLEKSVSGSAETIARPTLSVFDGLDLPGASSDTIDPTVLHRHIANGMTIAQAARVVGIPPGVASHILWIHPRQDPPTTPLAISVDQLDILHHHHNLSIRTIARTYDVDRKTLRRLMSKGGVSVMSKGERAARRVDPEWLRTRYIDDSATLSEIANELGISQSTVRRLARTHGLQLRPPGRSSWAVSPTDQQRESSAPAVLRPALVRPGGRDRLRAFEAAMTFATLTEAAQALGTPQPQLSTMIRRLENDLGDKLVRRANRGAPMSLTPFGETIVEAIRRRTGSDDLGRSP